MGFRLIFTILFYLLLTRIIHFYIFYFHFLFFVGTDGTIVGILFSAISDLVASGCFIFLSLSFVCGTLSGVPHISMGSSVWDWRAWFWGSRVIVVVLLFLCFVIFLSIFYSFNFLVRWFISWLECQVFLISQLNSLWDHFKCLIGFFIVFSFCIIFVRVLYVFYIFNIVWWLGRFRGSMYLSSWYLKNVRQFVHVF